MDQATIDQAPHIVGTTDQRVLMASGDRAYVLGNDSSALVKTNAPDAQQYRIFRDAIPLKDPATQEVLGYEAKYLGNANLLEGQRDSVTQGDQPAITCGFKPLPTESRRIG